MSMSDVDQVLFDDALVLVALLPEPRDLEIARMLGWYRIPFRTAPKIIEADYIAFYQPAAFPDGERFIVKRYAAISGVELTTRAMLLKDEIDHPRANEQYYKIQINNLQNLQNPIKSGNWKRFTFLYTTGRYLPNAKCLKDLTVHSIERELLWHSIRERLEAGHIYSEKKFENIPPEIAFLLSGRLQKKE